MQLTVPLTSVYVPEVHGAQDGRPPSENVPSGHCRHTEESPVDARRRQYVPAPHGLHADKPGTSAYVPAGHGSHDAPVLSEYAPFGQSRHTSTDVPPIAMPYAPLGQPQNSKPCSAAYVPASHSEQLTDATGAYEPSSQSKQLFAEVLPS